MQCKESARNANECASTIPFTQLAHSMPLFADKQQVVLITEDEFAKSQFTLAEFCVNVEQQLSSFRLKLCLNAWLNSAQRFAAEILAQRSEPSLKLAHIAQCCVRAYLPMLRFLPTSSTLRQALSGRPNCTKNKRAQRVTLNLNM